MEGTRSVAHSVSDEQRKEIWRICRRDPRATEFMVNLAWVACHSYRHDTVLRPFPSSYVDRQGGKKDQVALVSECLSPCAACCAQLCVVYRLNLQSNYVILSLHCDSDCCCCCSVVSLALGLLDEGTVYSPCTVALTTPVSLLCRGRRLTGFPS